MPRLDNPKHEAFALNLAKSVKQIEAYALAGYSPNPSAASRLAAEPMIADRIVELQTEIRGKINTAMARPNEETFASLKEMGLTMEWVAEQYKNIYHEALEANSFAAANTAVKNIQKLIEIETGGGTGEEEQHTPTIKINEVTDMLVAVKELVQLGQKEGTYAADQFKDVTPQQVLATQVGAGDNDHSD